MGKTESGWQTKAVDMDFYYLKGILEKMMDSLNIVNYSITPEQANPMFHPGRTAVVHADGTEACIIGEVHPTVVENYRLSERVYIMQVNLEEIIRVAGGLKEYKPLPKYPAIERDIAIVVPQDILAADVYADIRKNAGTLLDKISLFDVYQGEQIKSGYKSMAFSLRFQASDRTLTDEEVNAIHEKIAESLKNNYNAELRA